MRPLGLLAIAGTGAGLALVVAYALGALSGTTTVEQFVAPPTGSSGTGARRVRAVDSRSRRSTSSTRPAWSRSAPARADAATGPARRPVRSARASSSTRRATSLTNSHVIAGARSVEVSFSGTTR